MALRHAVWQEPIARTGFWASFISYILFWLADLVRPGFVARYLSVHLFLLAAIIFAIWWSRAMMKPRT